jgi:hypothetical protein
MTFIAASILLRAANCISQPHWVGRLHRSGVVRPQNDHLSQGYTMVSSRKSARRTVGVRPAGATEGGHAGCRRIQAGAGKTPQRRASLAALPPHKFTHQVRNNVPVVVYADPTICNCLYVGNQAAYDSYLQTMKAKNAAAAQEADAKLEDWGVWPAFGP